MSMYFADKKWCAWCGEDLVENVPGGRGNRKYCNDDCKRAYKHSMQQEPCPTCGKPKMCRADECKKCSGQTFMEQLTARQKIVEKMHKEGFSDFEISERCGVSKRTVIKDRLAMGYRTSNGGRVKGQCFLWTEETFAKAKARMIETRDFKVVSKEFGLSPTALRARLRRKGFKLDGYIKDTADGRSQGAGNVGQALSA